MYQNTIPKCKIKTKHLGVVYELMGTVPCRPVFWGKFCTRGLINNIRESRMLWMGTNVYYFYTEYYWWDMVQSLPKFWIYLVSKKQKRVLTDVF